MRAAIVAGGLVALLAIVAIGSRSQGWRGGDRRDVSPFAVDVAFTLAILLGIALVALIVLTVRSAKGQVKLERPSGLARVVLVLAAFTFIGAYGLSRYEFRPNEEEENDAVLGPPTTTQREDDVRTPEPPREPRFQWWLAALAAGGTTAAIVVWYRRRRPPLRLAAAHDAVAEELTEVLSDTLDDLAGERDPRRAVIRAYARMEGVLASHGLPRAPHETPLEYLARVLRELNVRAEAAHALTELFERARFSQHEIDLAMKDEAIDALVRVRDDLEAAA